MPFVVGETIGQYRIIEQLGQGGMATVFKAYHASLDRYVALKALHPAFLEDKNFLARFQREARVVAKLEHPNIVPIYDFAEHEGRPYLVMKYIQGITLKARLEEKPLSSAEIVRIIEVVGSALAYAHSQGILHRDIKPSNVLIADDGQYYLADFGLARMAQTGESSLTADRMVGTPQYMSPEQALAKSDLDARSDIYSFGVMLYEMLVGKVPFNADTPFAVIHDHIYSPLPLPRQANPAVSESVERILLKALAKNPDDRYADVASMVSAFSKAMIAEDPGLASISVAGASAPTMLANAVEEPGVNKGETVVSKSQEIKPVIPPAEKTPSGLIPPTPAPEKVQKHKTSPLVIILAVIGAISLLFLCLVIIGGILSNKAKASQATRTAQVALLITKPVENTTPPPVKPTSENSQKAYDLANDAITAWEDNDMAMAAAALDEMQTVIGTDTQLYNDVFKMMADKKAWLLVAMLAVNPRTTTADNIITQGQEQIHMAVYLAAADEKSADFFTNNPNRPLLLVASIRHELYFGDSTDAKQRLGRVLDTQVLMNRFPEAHLLEGEIFLVLKDNIRANRIFGDIKNDQTYPLWVRNFAKELENQVKK